jgi:ribonuclease D
MTLITEGAQLAAFCERLAGADIIAVDTEFMR